jgi:hypothetical protein
MTAAAYTTLILTFCLIPLGASIGTAEVLRVKAVEFRGLACLTKYDIVRGVSLKATDRGILIDIDSLRRSLSKNDFIKNYRIDIVGGNLVVSVLEKRPAHVIVISRGGKSNTYELDAGYRVISKNIVHANNLPVLHVTDGEAGPGGLQAEVKRIFAVLAKVRQRNAAIYRELSEIYLSGGNIRVLLRGRRTDFILAPKESEFKKLRYIAGYLDRTRTYPDEIIISDNTAVIR